MWYDTNKLKELNEIKIIISKRIGKKLYCKHISLKKGKEEHNVV